MLLQEFFRLLVADDSSARTIVGSNATNDTIPAFDMDIDYRYMTDGTYIGLVLTAFFSAFLSLAGSTSILYFILVSNRRNGDKRRESSTTIESNLDQQQGSSSRFSFLRMSRLNATGGSNSINTTKSSRKDNSNSQDKMGLYHRLLVGLSVVDWIAAMDGALQPILIPRHTHYLLASGNTATCRFAGFWFTSFSASYIYSTALSLYFYLTIRLGKKEQDAAAILEPYAHIMAIAFPIALSVLQIAFDMIKPNVLFIACVSGLKDQKPECVMTTPEQQKAQGINCTSGAAEYVILWIPVLVTFVGVFIGTVATFSVYWSVRRQTLSSRRHSFAGEISAAQLARTRAVGRQAILYFLAYLNSFVVTMLASTVPFMSSRKIGDPKDMFGSAIIYGTIFMMYLCLPLQGFFNCIIFMRPRVVKWMEAEPTKSWFWCYRQVLAGSTPPVRRQTKITERLSGAGDVRLSSIHSSNHGVSQHGEQRCNDRSSSLSCQGSSAIRSPSLHKLVNDVAAINSALTSEDEGMNSCPSEAFENEPHERVNSASTLQQDGGMVIQTSDALERERNECVNSAVPLQEEVVEPQISEAF